MKIRIEAAEERLRAAATRFVSEAEAAYFADLVLQAHLRKAPRMNPLEEAVDDLETWVALAEHEVRVDADKESVLLLDFDGLAPSLKLKHVHDELERRARKNGMAAVGFRNSSGVVTLGPWSEGLAGRDLIGVAMFDGGTGCTVPFGGTKGVFGTLPLAYAIPTTDQPITLDMAMTEIPYFQIDQAKSSGEPLPPGAAVDQNGLPTTDAAAALDDDGVANLLPIGGGIKGYGLAMLIEILTGSLIRSLLSTDQTPGWHPPEYGGLVCAIDIGSFTDLDRFKNEVTQMCHAIREQPGADGGAGPVIPGDRGHEKVATGLADGEIEVADAVVGRLEALAAG